MTKKLLVSFCVLSGISFGQTFTAANEFAIGESQTMYMCDSAAPSYAAVNGTGVTWDYSSYMKVNNPNRIYSVSNNTNTATYPTANKVVTIQDVLTTMYETSASSRSIVGLEYTSGQTIPGTVVANFSTDALHVMDYDFALNEEIVDVFSGSMTSSLGPSTATGASLSEVDATGTLILSPTVTKTNVVRHHLIDTINTTVFGQNIKLIISEYDYYDFVANNLPLFSHVNIKIIQNGTNQLSNMNFVLNTEEPAYFVGMEEQAKAAFKVFPNPAGNTLQITGDLTGSELFTIIDIAGKTVLTAASAKVDISSLQPGAYVVQVEKDGVRTQQKFIKK
ncbi:MAG: T9SS type A sorting domain-containing protein [Bacteroidota bacterium]